MAREKGMGSLQLEKSGRWTVRFSYHGKAFSRSARTTNREQAERFLQKILAPLGLGEHRLPLADAWHTYEVSPNRRELSPSTLHTKRIAWMHFASWIEKWHPEVTQVAGITREAVAEYLRELRNGHTASTYNGRVCILREIFRVLSDKCGLIEDPWEHVMLLSEDSHSRRELTLDELKRLLAATGIKPAAIMSQPIQPGTTGVSPVESPECRGPSHPWRTLFLIGIYTGLRLGDCCLLEWKSVLLDRGVIQLIPRKTRKHAHGIPVTIPIHPVLRAELEREVQRAGCQLSQYVMPNIAADYQHHVWRVMDGIAAIFKAAGIRTSVMLEGRHRATPEATFHSLRHTFVSFAANAGVPLPVIASIVGHTSTAMTRHYYHESEAALRKAVASIPEL